MKKFLLLTVMCLSVAFGTLRAQNNDNSVEVYRLESIEHTNDWDKLDYVYESETSDKVIQVIKGEDHGYGVYVTVLKYDKNGMIAGSEYKWRDANGNLIPSNYTDIFEYTYTDGFLSSYKETAYYDWEAEMPDWSPTVLEYIFTRDADGNVTKVASATAEFFYTYENGKLVKEVKTYYDDWAETPGFVSEYEIEYAYDENGNCISATQYSLYDGEKTLSKGAEYHYDLTISVENARIFTYPHEIKPAYTNLITEIISYDCSENPETGEITKTNQLVQTYNYSLVNIELPEVPEDPTVAIEELTATTNIYPNPVNDVLYIETEFDVEGVSIYSITGVLVGQQTTNDGQQSLSVDVTDLTSGVYFVNIVTEKGNIIKRVIKN